MRPIPKITALLSLLLTATPPAAASDALPNAVSTFLSAYCLDCHSPPRPKAKINIENLLEAEPYDPARPVWENIQFRVRDREMPPEDEPQPSADEILEFSNTLESERIRAICSEGATPGPPLFRRMNRREYSASIRELLGIHFDAGENLPEDGAGGEGFDNASEILFISPIHAERYLDAARSALEYAFADTRSNQRFLVAQPNDELSAPDAAAAVLQDFLPRAFRRPVNQEELANYLETFDAAYQATESFQLALKSAMESALISPSFLFIVEEPPSSSEPEPLSPHEMASRLSYFLWGSGPDRTLLEAANKGELQSEESIARHALRLLDAKYERKTREFAQTFVEQWLGVRALGREYKPDASIQGYDSELEGGLKYEPVFFFHEILTENRSLLELIDADYTYVNRRLARHYGIDGSFREQPKRVELPESSFRGGVLTMGSTLAVSSLPHRTSPTLRGAWILEKIFGDPPPPPPPNVPELPESEEETEGLSLREKLDAHRVDPACANCHKRIDPLGFALENLDVLGRWRDTIDGIPIDSRGSLPDGSEFNGPMGLKDAVLARKDRFVRNLARKALGYALARSLTIEEQCVVDEIVESVIASDYKSQALILSIVKSVPFRFKAPVIEPVP